MSGITLEMLLAFLVNYGLPVLITFIAARYGDKLPILAALLKLFPASPLNPQPVPQPLPTPAPAPTVPPWMDLLTQLLPLLLKLRSGVTLTAEEQHMVGAIQALMPAEKK